MVQTNPPVLGWKRPFVVGDARPEVAGISVMAVDADTQGGARGDVRPLPLKHQSYPPGTGDRHQERGVRLRRPPPSPRSGGLRRVPSATEVNQRIGPGR